MKILNFKNNSNIWQARKILKKILEENFGKGLGRAVKVPIIEQLLNNEIIGPSQKLKNCFRNGLLNKGY